MEILITEPSSDYELIDSGDGEKLERYGSVVMSRPDPQAIWEKSLGDDEWKKAQAKYIREGTTGKWELTDGLSEIWQIKLLDFTFNLKFLPSKHLGIFPEQTEQWKWLEEKIKNAGRPISVLNLFAYTGGATMVCARAGAEVVHLDASKFVVDIAHKNLDDSGLGDKKVRFIEDDVRKFVEREVKRGNKYDVILLDPPIYGKGSNDKVWNLDVDLPLLVTRLKDLLSDKPIAVVLNGYSSGYSSITYSQLISTLNEKINGKISYGEYVIKESGGRLLPAGIWARIEK